MHMSDALLSPVVGCAAWAVSAAAVGFSVKKIADSGEDKKIPLMGIMGAFVFAGQMINFTIPGTGSSGHIGGGILLAALLGPWGALIAIAGVLLIQCLFFADGGFLAYGANVLNMGVIPCLLAYPFLFKLIAAGRGSSIASKTAISAAAIISVVIGLQVGAFGVVLETLASGITELPFGAFLLLMQPIHLAIGLGEGIATALVLCFVHKARPELLDISENKSVVEGSLSYKKTLGILGGFALVVAALLSLFASEFPDGLEWSMEKVAGTAELEREGGAYSTAGSIVESTAFLPDYGFKDAPEDAGPAGTSVSGIVGSVLTFILAAGIAALIHFVRRPKREE